jgi:hypothetical protein
MMLTNINLTANSGETIQAQLNQMQPRHLEDFETAWQEVLQELNQDDAFWSWAMKKRLSLAALLFFARQRSLALGYNGRVGLHALPASEGFYHHEQMLDYGEDPDKDNLRYFEFGTME